MRTKYCMMPKCVELSSALVCNPVYGKVCVVMIESKWLGTAERGLQGAAAEVDGDHRWTSL